MSLPAEVKLYLKCEDATDDSASAHSVTNTGVAFGSGKLNDAGTWEPADDFTISEHADFKPSGDFAFSFWMYYSGTPTDAGGRAWDFISGNYGVRLRFGATMLFDVEIGNGTTLTNTGNFAMDSGNWNHVVVNYDKDGGTGGKANMRIYKNTFLGFDVEVEVAAWPTGKDLVIDPSGDAASTDVLIDDLVFIHRMLTGSEISALWNGSTGQEADAVLGASTLNVIERRTLRGVGRGIMRGAA